MKRADVHIVLSLTRKQADALSLRAVGAALASEESPSDRLAWQHLADAIRDGVQIADINDRSREVRTNPCPRCARPVVFKNRGYHGTTRHRCPHGRDCVSLFACAKCNEARKSDGRDKPAPKGGAQ